MEVNIAQDLRTQLLEVNQGLTIDCESLIL